jgi:hypothetical protein
MSGRRLAAKDRHSMAETAVAGSVSEAKATEIAA